MTAPVVPAGLPADTVFEGELDLAGGRATAVFNTGRTERLLLTRIWDPALPITAWVTLNPSTATAHAMDNTLRRTVTFSRTFGCGGLAITNLFALRSTHPQALLTHPEPAGDLNDMFIRHTVRTAAATGGPVIAAWGSWGNHTRLRHRTQAVTQLLTTADTPVQCLGTTSASSGKQPLHPLMLASSTTLLPYHLDRT